MLKEVIFIVETTFTSGGSATLAFDLTNTATTALSGNIAVANLAAGDVFNLLPHDAVSATNNLGDLYAKSSAYNLTMTVGTAAFTAGQGIVLAKIIEVGAMADQL
jgi:hypothetical protein